MNILPVNLDDLINTRTVESVRVEFKKTWNQPIIEATLRSICAFANDLQELNGGYIVIGIEEHEGKPVLPPHGLEGIDLDRLQKKIRGNCNKLHPEYQPRVVPCTYQDRPIVVIWAPQGDMRPYQAPEHLNKKAHRRHYVRVNSETVDADSHPELREQLMQVAARIPFDERRCPDVPLTAISPRLIQEFLRNTGSFHAGEDLDVADALRTMRLSARINGSEAPRNVALLFFTEQPDRYLPTAYLELAHFRDDTGGDLIETHRFTGPLDQQIQRVVEYLDTMAAQVTRKMPGQTRAERFVAFPFEALREAVVNAVYHRGYEESCPPARIGLYPDRLEITSFPGPVPGLMHEHLQPDAHPPQLPARNPHIGDLLKRLKLAETWHTGVPKIHRRMHENGSPAPIFDFDEARTYFRVTLPAHPGYVVLHALREAAAWWHTGERQRALAHLRAMRARAPGSGALTAQLIEYAAAMDDMPLARQALAELDSQPSITDRSLAYMAMARAYLDRDQTKDADRLLHELRRIRDAETAGTGIVGVSETIDLAILSKRVGDFEEAHSLFASVASDIATDPKALHEFAQCKLRIAQQLRRTRRRPQDRDAKRRLNQEAEKLLRRVIALAADQPVRRAWAWFDLARTLAWQKTPEDEVRRACRHAMELLPDEPRFSDWLAQRQQRSRTKPK